MKTLGLSAIDAFLDSSAYREMKRMEEAQRGWIENLQPIKTLSEQLRSLTEPASVAAKMAEEFQRAERQQLDHIRTMLDPIADIRKSLMFDSSNRKLKEEIERPSFLSAELERAAREATHFDHVAKAMQESMQSSFSHAQEMLAATSIAGSLAQTMSAFKEAERRWSVPAELVDSIGALKAMQEQLGRLTLPVVDFASASTLARLLGPEGMEAQLAALGIAPDGTLSEEALAPVEAGIGVSRRTLELMTLLSFVLTFLVPIYQELSSREWQKQTDERLEAQRLLLQTQAKQLESLSHLVEKALVQEAKRDEQRFVVLDRIATVRCRPEHGAPVEGKLFPREVVKPISEQGKWIQFEYFHWLLQSHQTGWALKKYFKRIPVSHSDGAGGYRNDAQPCGAGDAG
jgi:hypothetical protein